MALLEDGLLSLRLEGEESRGDGHPSRVRWGDVWKVREGAPCPLKEVLGKGRGWRKRLLGQVIRQGNQRREAGDCFLDGDWAQKARKWLPIRDFCLTLEGVELVYPQCSIAPAAEGTPVFGIPREGMTAQALEF